MHLVRLRKLPARNKLLREPRLNLPTLAPTGREIAAKLGAPQPHRKPARTGDGARPLGGSLTSAKILARPLQLIMQRPNMQMGALIIIIIIISQACLLANVTRVSVGSRRVASAPSVCLATSCRGGQLKYGQMGYTPAQVESLNRQASWPSLRRPTFEWLLYMLHVEPGCLVPISIHPSSSSSMPRPPLPALATSTRIRRYSIAGKVCRPLTLSPPTACQPLFPVCSSPVSLLALAERRAGGSAETRAGRAWQRRRRLELID